MPIPRYRGHSQDRLLDFTVLGRKREAAERGMAVGGCIYVNKQQSPGEWICISSEQASCEFGLLSFFKTEFWQFSAIWARREAARKRRDEGSLCIPGEEAIVRREVETVKYRNYLSQDSKVVQTAFGLSSAPHLLSIIKNGNYLL